jgi:ABC-type antimicrobial peptide transport system permease subunit
MAESKLTIAALVVGVLALIAVTAFGLYFLLRKTPGSAAPTQSLTNSLVTNQNKRSLLANFPAVNRCDASNPCTSSIESSLCLPGSPGNPSANEIYQCYNDGSSYAWTGVSQIPHSYA